MAIPYADRHQAGNILADELKEYADQRQVIVLALPRGGVPVGAVIAAALGAPLDVILVRKLGLPGHEELAMGAIATGNARVMNDDVLRFKRVSESAIERVVEKERKELERREKTYRGDRPLPNLEGRTVILVDDGLATGATMRAAIQVVRQQSPEKIVMAVPVAPRDTLERMREEADEVVCPAVPSSFMGIGQWYQDFGQTSDQEVKNLLEQASR
ncbi:MULTISPECIES: phosphoribosyltransferase [Halomonas]|uniref:Putative phosphoribosyl transferase n=1 Tax=Halomonas ventosae TaxID=229007 RepID=A0A4R6I5F7_9GAMM|nr:phosphoribosyltransferase [Halomonas ventosae]TDO16714.1 putative phosphoribosyl transferase [Halomonas ventosae]